MITWTLLIWACTAQGCHAEPPRPVYAHLTAETCRHWMLAELGTTGDQIGEWPQARCLASNERKR